MLFSRQKWLVNTGDHREVEILATEPALECRQSRTCERRWQATSRPPSSGAFRPSPATSPSVSFLRSIHETLSFFPDHAITQILRYQFSESKLLLESDVSTVHGCFLSSSYVCQNLVMITTSAPLVKSITPCRYVRHPKHLLARDHER
jgi:hypothetical protein